MFFQYLKQITTMNVIQNNLIKPIAKKHITSCEPSHTYDNYVQSLDKDKDKDKDKYENYKKPQKYEYKNIITIDDEDIKVGFSAIITIAVSYYSARSLYKFLNGIKLL